MAGIDDKFIARIVKLEKELELVKRLAGTPRSLLDSAGVVSITPGTNLSMIVPGTVLLDAGGQITVVSDGIVSLTGTTVDLNATTVSLDSSGDITGSATDDIILDANDRIELWATNGVHLLEESLRFGSRYGQLMNLYSDIYGIGMQNLGMYFRVPGTTAWSWYSGGVHSDTALDPGVGGTRRMVLDGLGQLLIGGKSSANAAVTGVELRANGQVMATTEVVGASNAYLVHRIGTPADATGQIYVRFMRDGTTIGSITQASTTTVAYGGTSDQRLKAKGVDVDDEQALELIRQLRPVRTQWLLGEDGNATPHGKPGGEPFTTFFAQELHKLLPEAVIVGHGEFGDEDEYEEEIITPEVWATDVSTKKPVKLAEAEVKRTMTRQGFVPWMVDRSVLVPYLTAAIQALDRTVVSLTDRLASVENRLGLLEAKTPLTHTPTKNQK